MAGISLSVSSHIYGGKYLDRQGLWSRAVPGPSERTVTWLQCMEYSTPGLRKHCMQQELEHAQLSPHVLKAALILHSGQCCDPGVAHLLHTHSNTGAAPARVTCLPHNPAGMAAWSSWRCPCLRENNWHLMIYKVLFQSKQFYDFISKCDNNLTRHDGKVYLAVNCIEDRDRRNCQADPPLLSHEVQKGPPYFLNSFLKRNLGVPGSRLSPRLGQQFASKGFCAQCILYLSRDFSFVCY